MSLPRDLMMILALLPLAAAGCGESGDEMAPVRGRVTLDGNPVPNASVVFQTAEKPPSGGYTDQNGNYELIFKRGVKGAPVGMNKVTILKNVERTPGPQLPARYNQNSELEREVKPGDNEINFDLRSDGK